MWSVDVFIKLFLGLVHGLLQVMQGRTTLAHWGVANRTLHNNQALTLVFLCLTFCVLKSCPKWGLSCYCCKFNWGGFPKTFVTFGDTFFIRKFWTFFSLFIFSLETGGISPHEILGHFLVRNLGRFLTRNSGQFPRKQFRHFPPRGKLAATVMLHCRLTNSDFLLLQKSETRMTASVLKHVPNTSRVQKNAVY